MDTTNKRLNGPRNAPAFIPVLDRESLLGCPGDTLCLSLTPFPTLQMKLSPINTCQI